MTDVTRALLIGCSSTKRDDPGLLPAIERYQGPIFQTLRQYQRGGYVPWRTIILSARYGIIEADTPIVDYDTRMDLDAAQAIVSCSTDTNHLIRMLRELDEPAELFGVCGARYRLVFEAMLAGTRWGGRIGWAEGGIGYQRQAMGAWLARLPAHA